MEADDKFPRVFVGVGAFRETDQRFEVKKCPEHSGQLYTIGFEQYC